MNEQNSTLGFSAVVAMFVRKLDNTIHRINCYPVDGIVYSVSTYPLNSDLSGGLLPPASNKRGVISKASLASHSAINS